MTKLDTFKNKFAHLLDPFVIMAIVVVFLIPVITVFNLTPQSRPQTNDKQVLGVTSSDEITVEANKIISDGISIETVEPNGEDAYVVRLRQLAHKPGKYSNELVTISNPTDKTKRIDIYGIFNGVAEGTKIAVQLENTKYIVLAPDGSLYPPSIYVASGQTMTLGIAIENTTNVNFDTNFALGLKVR